eukprot:5613280-Amphidinium_carterae.1
MYLQGKVLCQTHKPVLPHFPIPTTRLVKRDHPIQFNSGHQTGSKGNALKRVQARTDMVAAKTPTMKTDTDCQYWFTATELKPKMSK